MIKITYKDGYKIKFYPMPQNEIINYFINIELIKFCNKNK